MYELRIAAYMHDIGKVTTPVEIVEKAIKRKTGARALRSILEKSMLDVMYELPSLKGINSCTITKETIQKHTKPIYKNLKKIAWYIFVMSVTSCNTNNIDI